MHPTTSAPTCHERPFPTRRRRKADNVRPGGVFDNHITNADTPGYVLVSLSWQTISNKAGTEKKDKYRHVTAELQ